MNRRDLIVGLMCVPLIPAVAAASAVSVKPPRQLRMCSNYLCDCGFAMPFVGGNSDGKLREMACSNQACEHFGVKVQEPRIDINTGIESSRFSKDEIARIFAIPLDNVKHLESVDYRERGRQ